jgi:hypothetical protein
MREAKTKTAFTVAAAISRHGVRRCGAPCLAVAEPVGRS